MAGIYASSIVLVVVGVISVCIAGPGPEPQPPSSSCCTDWDPHRLPFPVIDKDCTLWHTGCADCVVWDGVITDNRTECEPTEQELNIRQRGESLVCCAYPYFRCDHPPSSEAPYCRRFKDCEEISGYDLYDSLGSEGGRCVDEDSLESCSASCDRSDECIAFNYEFESHSCCLWDQTVPGLDDWDGMCTYISYTSDCPQKSCFELYEGFGQHGGDCFESNSLDTCEAGCLADDNCFAFDWIEPNECCTWDEIIQDLKLWPGMCTYVRYGERGCPEIDGWDLYTDVGQNGGNCYGETHFQQCRYDCLDDPDCVGFDWIAMGCCIWTDSISELNVWPAMCSYKPENTFVLDVGYRPREADYTDCSGLPWW